MNQIFLMTDLDADLDTKDTDKILNGRFYRLSLDVYDIYTDTIIIILEQPLKS